MMSIFDERLKQFKISITGDLADFYHEKWIQDQVQSIYSPGMAVIDIGAGTRRYGYLFSPDDYKSYDFTNGYSEAHDFCCPILELPERATAGGYDLALCTQVIEHMRYPDQAIYCASQLLKRNGIFMLSAPLTSGEHGVPYHYYAGFSQRWYSEVLQDNDFQIISIESNGGYFDIALMLVEIEEAPV